MREARGRTTDGGAVLYSIDGDLQPTRVLPPTARACSSGGGDAGAAGPVRGAHRAGGFRRMVAPDRTRLDHGRPRERAVAPPRRSHPGALRRADAFRGT